MAGTDSKAENEIDNLTFKEDSDKLTVEDRLEFSNKNFINDLKTKTTQETRAKQKQLESVLPFLDRYTLALFADSAYKDPDRNKEDIDEDYEESLQLPQGWELLTTARSPAFWDLRWGYFGAAFWHPEHRRIVIAHRGTNNLDTIRADLMGVVWNRYVRQMNAACTFTHKVYEAISSVEKVYNVKFEIYFTGHSLGGWLAQVTTFSLKYLKLEKGNFINIRNQEDAGVTYKGYHAHTEVFDSPGCKNMLAKMEDDFDVRYADRKIQLHRLDITNHISSPNIVNCCNKHVGKLYRIFPEINIAEDVIEYTKQSHTLEGLLAKLKTPSSDDIEVVDWPEIEPTLWTGMKVIGSKILGTRQNKSFGKEFANFWQFAKVVNKIEPQDTTAYLTYTDGPNSKAQKDLKVRCQAKLVGKNQCHVSVFTDWELRFLQLFQQLKIIPNRIFDYNQTFYRLQEVIKRKLQQICLQGDILTCNSDSDIRQLVPYVKCLLRLFPELNEKTEDALTDFEVRKTIYFDLSQTYRKQINDLIKLKIEDTKDPWHALIKFFENKPDKVCEIQAHYGTDIAMAKALTTIPSSQGNCLILAFELQSLLTTETFFTLKEFVKHKNLEETIILIECAGELGSNTERGKYLHDLRDEIKSTKTSIKLVFITDGNNQDLMIEHVIKHDGITWGELTIEAQEDLMNRKVIKFQGNENSSLKDLFFEDDFIQFEEVLKGEILFNLIKNKVITVGKELQSLGDVDNYYIPREFQLKDVIDEKCLNNIDSSELIALNDPRFANQENCVQITEDEDFQRLCELYPMKNIHWLKYDSKLIWYKSRGKLDYLRKYLVKDQSSSYSEKTLVEKSGKSLIISDTPGMGKSTVLSVLGQKIKLKYPNYWVIRLNLNTCTKTLESAIKGEISIASRKELSNFMLKYILPCSENTTLKNPFEKKLFEISITSYGRLVLLFDGFDEISPTYDSQVIKMLEALMKTRVDKIIISTRPYTKEQLEDCFSCWAHTMVPFSKEDQVEFIVKYLQKHFYNLNIKFPETIEDLNKYVSTSINNLSKSIMDHERQFMGVPLQCRLLASYMLRNISNGQFAMIDNVALIDLYENFIEGKVVIYDNEKCSPAGGNVATNNAQKSMKSQILQKHRQYALQLLLHENVYEELNYPELEVEEGLLENSLLKAGVYIGNLTFIHRTFAEYFVMDYLLVLAKNTKRNAGSWNKLSILNRETMLKAEFAVVRTFLDVLIRNGKNCEESEKILRSYVKFLAENYPTNLPACHNASKETVLHVLIREGQLDTLSNLIDILSKENQSLLKLLVQYQERQNEKVEWWNFDGSHGFFSPLYLACRFGYTEIVEKLLEAGSDVNPLECDRFSPLYVACLYSCMQNGADVETRPDIDMSRKHPASSNKHVEIAELLLNAGADVNCGDSEDKETPLQLVSYQGQIDVAKLLIDRGANYELKNHRGETPMLSSASGGSVDVVKLLLERGANCDLKNDDGETPMHHAAEGGHVDVVKLLIERGANCDLKIDDGETPMHSAAYEGHVDVMKLLIERGANYDLKNDSGETPMHIAAYRGRVDVVKLLLERGANYDLTSKRGETPMLRAAYEGHADVVKLLLERGAYCDLKNVHGETPMHGAAFRGHVDVVILLLERGANCDLKNDRGETPMHSAALGGHVDVLKLLIERGANCDLKNVHGETLMHRAAFRGRVDVLKLLIERGANCNLKNVHGETPMHFAAYRGHVDVVKVLIEGGANPDLKNEKGETPMYNAALGGHVDVVKLLIECGANYDLKNDDDETPMHIAASYIGYVVKLLLERGANYDLTSNRGETPMHRAAYEGNADVVKLLLERGANCDIKSVHCETPMHVAAYGGHVDVVKLLIERGANYDLKNDRGETPMYNAALGGHVDVVKLLIERGANPDLNNDVGETPMHRVAYRGHVDVLNLLIDGGANCDLKNVHGETPVHRAAVWGHVDVVKLLIERGANYDLKNDRGETPMHSAAEWGHVDVVKLLIERGANPDLNNDVGETPMHRVAYRGHVDVLNLLIDGGANCDIKNVHGETPMHRAAVWGRVDVVKLLIERGANYDLKNDDGETPMHIAAYGGHVDVVKLLLEHRAKHDLKNELGETPMHRAAYRGHADVVKLLLERGANPQLKNKKGETLLKIARRLKHEDVVELLSGYIDQGRRER